MAELLDVDRRLFDVLAAHDGPAGICPRVPRLAKLLGCSVSTVQRSLRRLEAAGMVETVPVFERDDILEWKRRLAAGFTGEQPRRQTSNSYRVLPGPGSTPKTEIAGHPPVARPGRATPERGDLSTPPVEERGSEHERHDDDDATGGRFTRVDLTRADVDRLDHDPKDASEILATIQAGFGDASVLEVRRNDGKGPTYATARGRLIDLETCPTGDLHQALDQLDRHACSTGDRCEGNHRCKRHAPRRRSR
jgi:Helix-turn-helix domain